MHDAARMDPTTLISSPAHQIDTGSKIEGFCIPQLYLARGDGNPFFENLMEKEHWQPDSDSMFVKSHIFKDSKGTPHAMFTVKTASDDPRYVKLKLTEQWKGEFQRYKSSTFLNHAFVFPTSDHPLVEKSKEEGTNEWSVDVHGPVRKLYKGGFLNYEEDQAYVFTYPAAWPEHAMEWLVRPRPSSWPSPDLIQDIIESGCHIAPVGRGARTRDPVTTLDYVKSPSAAQPSSETIGATNEMSMDETEWRISFSVAENKLAASVSPVQRHVMVLLKMLKKLYFEKMISSYHLKNLLFWECEVKDPRFWNEENSGFALLSMLDCLSKCLKERCLPHYIIPESNLLQYEDPETLDKAADLVDDARKNILSRVVSMLMRLQSFTYLSNIYLDGLHLEGILRQMQDSSRSGNTHIELTISICNVFAAKCKKVIMCSIRDDHEEAKNFIVPLNAYKSILARILCRKWCLKSRECCETNERLMGFFEEETTDLPISNEIITLSLEYHSQLNEGIDPSLFMPNTTAMVQIYEAQKISAAETFSLTKETVGLFCNPDDLKDIEKKVAAKLHGTLDTISMKDIEAEVNKELAKLFEKSHTK